MRKQNGFISRRRRTTRISRYGYGCIKHLSGAWIAVDRRRHVIIDGSSEFGAWVGVAREGYVGKGIDCLAAGPANEDGWPEKRFGQGLVDLPGRHEEVSVKTAAGVMVAEVTISEPASGRHRGVVFCWFVDRTAHYKLQRAVINQYRKLKGTFPEQANGRDHKRGREHAR